MNQFGLRGRYWITPDRVIDTSSDEHARVAKGFMLGLDDEQTHAQIKLPDIFKPLTKRQRVKYENFGASIHALEFLSQAHPDPRIYVIAECGWIRVRENAFYTWDWRENSGLAYGHLCRAHDYWKNQRPEVGIWMEFHSISPYAVEPEFPLVMNSTMLARIAESLKCSQATGGSPQTVR